MTNTITINKLTPVVKEQRRRAMARLKRSLRRRDITYREVAAKAQRSWSLAYHVLNARKTAPAITEAAHALVREHDATKPVPR